MDSRSDPQALRETLLSQVTVDRLPALSEDKINCFFEIIEELSDIHSGSKNKADLPDLQGKINELRDFSLKMKENQEASNNLFDLLKLFATTIEEINLIIKPPSPPSQESVTQPLIENLLSQITPESFPGISQEEVDALFEVIEELSEVHQGNKKSEDLPDFKGKINVVKDFSHKVRDNQETHKNFLDLLQLFGVSIPEITPVSPSPVQESDTQSIIESLLSSLTTDNFPKLTQENIDELFEIIEDFNEVCQREKKIGEITNSQDRISKLKEVLLIINENQDVHRDYMSLLGIFATHIEELKPVLEQKDEENQSHPLLEALKAQIHLENFPFITQEQTDSYQELIQRLNKLYYQSTLNNDDIPQLITEARNLWLEIRDHRETSHIFAEVIALLESKGVSLKDVFTEDESAVTEKENKLEEVSKKDKLKAVELGKEKKSLLEFFETTPAIALKCFYKYQVHLEKLGISIPKLCVPNDLPKYRKFAALKNLEESKDEKDPEKMFQILIDILTEMQSFGILRLWRDKNPNAPVIESYEGAIGLLLHVQTREQFLRLFLQQCILKDQDNMFTKKEVADMRKAFSMHNPDSLYDEQNLDMIKECWSKIVLNDRAVKLANIILNEAAQNNSSLKQFVTDIEKHSQVSSSAKDEFHHTIVKEVKNIKADKKQFEEEKFSDIPLQEPELPLKSDLKNSPMKTQQDSEANNFEIIELDDVTFFKVQEKQEEERIALNKQMHVQIPSQSPSQQPDIKIAAGNQSPSRYKVPSPQKDYADLPAQDKGVSSSYSHQNEESKVSQSPKREVKQDVKDSAFDNIQSTHPKEFQISPHQPGAEFEKELPSPRHAKIQDISDHDEHHSVSHVNPVGSASKDSFEKMEFRRRVEAMMNNFSSSEMAQRKNLSKLLEAIQVNNVNIMDSVLNSDLGEKKDICSLLAENEFLHHFYAIVKNGFTKESKTRLIEFYKAIETICQEYTPQDLENRDKVTEMKRNVGVELQTLFNLSMKLYVVLKLCKGFTWHHFKLSLVREKQADNNRYPQSFIKKDEFTRREDGFSYGLFIFTLPLCELKTFKKKMHLALYVPTGNGYFFCKAPICIDPLLDFHNKFIFDVNLNSSSAPAQACENLFETYVVFATFLADGDLIPIRFDFLNQLQDMPFEQDTLTRILFQKSSKYLLSLLANEGLKTNRRFCICLLGKMISWKAIIQKDTVFFDSISFVYGCCELTYLLNLALTDEKKLRQGILDYLKSDIIVRIKTKSFKPKAAALIHSYVEKLNMIQILDNDPFEFLVKAIECMSFTSEEERLGIVNPVISALKNSTNLPNSIKLKYLVCLYDRQLEVDLHFSLMQINAALSIQENDLISPDQETLRKIDQLFYRSTAWKTLTKNNRVNLYKFISSNDMVPELRMTIERSHIQRLFVSYLEGIFKSNNIEDIEFLRTIFIDVPNPNFVSYKAEDVIIKFVSRGYIERKLSLPKLTCLHFMENLFFPYYSDSNNPAKSMKENFKYWANFTSIGQDEALLYFDDLLRGAETRSGKTKHLEDLADQVCLEFLNSNSYINMGLVKISKAVEWRSISLKESFFNNFFAKLENEFGQKEEKEVAANNVIETVLNHSNIPEDLRNSIFTRVSITCSDITYKDIRNAIVTDPSSARLYSSLLRNINKTQNGNVGSTITRHLKRVVTELCDYEITIDEIEAIRNYDAKKTKLMLDLLENVGMENKFSELLDNLYKLVACLQAKILLIDSFLDFFDDYHYIKDKKAKLSKLRAELNGKKLSTLILVKENDEVKAINLSQDFEKFASIAVKTQGLLSFSFFKQFLLDAPTENDLVTVCDQAYTEMVNLFNTVIIGLKNKNLNMAIIKQYFFSLQISRFDQEMEEIAKHIKADEDLELLKKLLIYYLQYPDFAYISKSLIDFNYVVPLNSQSLIQCVNAYHDLALNLMNDRTAKNILASDFMELADKLVDKLDNFSLKPNRTDPINQIIHELSNGKDLCSFLEKVQHDNINELKDFVNDQEESLLNVRVIKGLEYVFHFKVNVIDKSKGLNEFVSRCSKMLQKNDWFDSQGYDDIQTCIKDCVTAKTALERTYNEMVSREASFKFRIMEIMGHSEVQIVHGTDNQKTVAVNPGKFSLRDLNEFKDKALLVINSNTRSADDNNEAIIDFDTLKKFTEFVDALNVILNSYTDLENLGFFQKFIHNPEKNSIEFRIGKNNFDEIERYKGTVRKYTSQFTNHLFDLYNESYLFAHFYSRQLKILHSTIMKTDEDWEKYAQNLALWANLDFDKFLEEISKVNVQQLLYKDPSEQLTFMKNLLERVGTGVDLQGQYINAFQKPFIKLVEVKKENAFLGMLAGVSEQEMLDVKLNQILFCHYNTNPLELTCFLQRAFLNGRKLPHFVLGIDDLSASLQSHFCETMDSLLKTLHRFKSNVNLIVIGSTTTEKVYGYLYHNKEFRREVVKNVTNEKQYFETLHKMAPNFEILVSATAGMGKTHTILDHCKSKKLKPVYFPIGGNINQDRIGERLSSIQVDQDTSLIIQIHNVTHKKILDELLFQLIFFRSLKSSRHLFFPKHKFYLFIELQNLLTENYLQSIRSLSIFDVSPAISDIKQVDCNKFELDHNDAKSHFVMCYLDAIEKDKIAVTDIIYEVFLQEFNQNKAGCRVNANISRNLLNKHFFEPLKELNPSFIQLRFFIDIFYSALRTFGGSPFLLTESLTYTFQDFNPKVVVKALRSDFVKILMENSRQFVRRTVSSEGFLRNEVGKGINFSEDLRNFPLLIMRQGEKEDVDYSYSFVYNNINRVPFEIRRFILALELGDKIVPFWDNPNQINEQFRKYDLTTKSPSELLEILMKIAGRQKLKPDDSYAVTLDNFYKMCLIIQRMRSRIPIIIMGETGVGKTALIRFLVENIYDDELLIFNIHAGVNEKDLIEKKNKIQDRLAKLKGKRLWVFFDEFNTSEELGYISEVLSSKRFLGEKLDDNLIFLGACNPFRKREANKNVEKVGIEKNKKIPSGDLLYKVLPPPESLIEAMWDYKELRETETLEYIKTMLKVKYKTDQVIDVIYYTHHFIKENIEKSAVSLRDVDRFRRLYDWFFKTMPDKGSVGTLVNRFEVFSNYNMDRSERALILTLCFCYYMRLPTVKLRQEYVETVEKKLEFNPGHVLKVLENEQIDLLTRMELPRGTALNRALRENVFSTFVCLMNKIPIIIVGMPGCSKSLSFRLLCTNLRGQNSYEEYFRSLEELSIVYFQGSESVTSEGVEKVFERASRSLKIEKVIPTILFDEIGLAEVSIHNPLKVLHAKLEGRPEISFIGLSNWELDAAKMGRFLVVARPLPDVVELHETAVKIFESILGIGADDFHKRIQTLSNSYSEFINNWRQKTVSLYPDFFGLRDFYSLIKYISHKINTEKIKSENRAEVAKILRRGIERNFDGQAKSVNLFLEKVKQDFYDPELEEKDELDVLSLIQENLNDRDARCLLLIIRGEALIHMVSQSVNTEGMNVITIHGSTFDQDKQNEQYNIRVLSEVINHVEKGNVIIFKDVNNSIQTSLYDLYNKAYHRVGGKNYCRVAVGANYNPKCFVHPNFNCIVYINEARLEDIDAPFLNRFEKHYLTLDRFLGEEELHLFNLLKQWMHKIMNKYLKNVNSALKRDNFIINSSDEAIASLCIKALQAARKPIQAQDGEFEVVAAHDPEHYINITFKQCKEQLLANTTVDFRFLVETSSEIKNDKAEYDFISEVYDAKYKTEISELCRKANNHLIVFTYDQNVSQYFLDGRIKTFKIVNMRCEKDIKDELDAYSHSHDELCVITLDYETEAVHLSLLLFLIDNMEKMNGMGGEKSFIIILHCSRIAVVASDEKPLCAISFLNGWSQVFLEELSTRKETEARIEVSRSIHPLIAGNKINLHDLFLNTYQNCIKRFDIKFASELENARSLTGFVTFLLEATDDKLFQDIATVYLDNKFKNEQIGDWRQEIINSKEFANLALNVNEAAKLYATKKAEEYCAMMMQFLLQKEIFISLFPTYGIDLLDKYIPGVKPILQEFRFNQEFTMKLINKVFLNTRGVQQRVPNLVEIFFEYPRLFPCSKIDQLRFFDLTDNKEDGKNLYSIATTINDLESRVVLHRMEKEAKEEEEKNQDDRRDVEEAKDEDMTEIHVIDNEDEIQFTVWNNKFKGVLETMTCLTTFEEGVCTFNMYEELEGPENHAMKELYLLDMRNEFIEKIAKTSLNGSVLLDKLIRLFLSEGFTVADYLLVLLRGGALWINLLQIYNVLSSVVTKDKFIEELFLPDLDIDTGFDLGKMLKAQTVYVDGFFDKCAELFAPQKKNIERMSDSKSYTTVFINIYFWLIKLQIDFSKYDVEMPITLNIWKNFVELIESISKGKSKEVYEKFDANITNNVDKNFFVTIDDILQDFKTKCTEEEEKAQISKFQATVLFRFWIANRDEIEGQDELATRLLARINQDKYFPNFCSNILGQLINTDNQVEIFENLKHLEDDVLIKFNESFDPTYNDTLSTIITDFFDKYIEDPEIVQVREEESEDSELLNINFNKFSEYWTLIEKQEQSNHIQLLYVMAFFKHYMRSYVECLIQDVKYKILPDIDNFLKKNTFLADSLCIFTLKILRIKLGSYKKLERFLYEVRKMQWIEKFEQSFKEIPDRQLFIPPVINMNADQANVQNNWKELIDSDLTNEGLFTQLITLAGKDHNTKYVLLNLFLTNVYVGSLSQPKVNGLKQLMQKHDALLKQHFNEYQIVLLNCYLNAKVDQGYLQMQPDLDAEETNVHITILNSVNWMVSLNNFVSPLTSLFFSGGKVAQNFSDHFQSMFMVTGLDNPFVECAQKAREACRFRGVYICSAQCKFIYTVEGCGWTNETRFCPFCCENIGNAQGKAAHNLARVDKGARRLGQQIPDWNGRYYLGNAAFHQDEKYWVELEADIDKEMDQMREEKFVRLNEGTIDNPQHVNVSMTGYNRMAEKIRDELQTPTLGRMKRLTDCFLRFILHSSLYVMIALKWISPQDALKIVPAQDLNRLLGYLKDIIQDCLKKLKEYLDCNDSLVWIIAMQQMMATTIQANHNANFTANTFKNRDFFEKVIEHLLDNHLGGNKVNTIKTYRQTSQVVVQKFDAILQEEELSNDYRFLQILRLVKLPSLDNMVNDYMDVIKTKYPILDECVKNVEQMETVSKLVSIVKFSNELMKLVDFQISRKEAEDTAISDLIERLPREKVTQMTKLLDGFLESWNSLELGPIQVECKTVGTTDRYDRRSKVIAFLVDSMQGKNQFGKILSGVIYNLGAQQNDILNQISGRAKNMKQLQNIKLFDDKEVIPQNCGPQDILDLKQETVEAIVFACSSNNYTYGNGVASYDFEAIQFNLMLKIMGKKLLLQNMNFYPNVKFIGEVFTSKSKFSSHIIDIRNLGLTNPIPNVAELEDKFKIVQDRSKNQFYSVLKQVLGSLERIMIFYKTLTKKGVTISDYVKNFKFNAISPVIVDEEPIRNYDISVIVALYEAFEKISTPFTWKIIPNIFKSGTLTNIEKKDLDKLFKEIQDEKPEAKTMPSLLDIGTATSRFAARCLVLDDENEPQFKPAFEIMPMMKEKEDIWPYPCDETLIENLADKFPNITFDKMFNLNEFIQARLNPDREGQNPRPQGREARGDFIPEKPIHKKKGTKTKVFIYQ